MIEFLSSWAQGIIVAVIIATLIEMILPNSSSKKYVKVVIGMYILFTIVSPIIKKLGGKDINLNTINIEKYEQQISKATTQYHANLKTITLEVLKTYMYQI